MAMRGWPRTAGTLAAMVALVAALAYLRDPPWLGAVTSGFGSWHEDEGGRRYRWTTRSHASFYVPATAELVTVPVRLGAERLDGAPVDVSLAMDGRVFATVVLDDPRRWVPLSFVLPAKAPARRAIRVEIIVRRLLPRGNLGVQVGEPVIRHRTR